MRFKIKKIPSLKMSIGERLKRARRRKRLSLEQIEEITKVRKRYLEDIEKNRFDNLPSDVYAKGFLFKYAQAVGVDPKEIVDLFMQDRGLEDSSKNPGQLEDLPQKGIKYPKIMITPKLAVTLISIILFLGFFGYIFLEVKNFAKAPGLEISKPTSTEMNVNSSSLEVAGKTDPGASVFINGQPIDIDLSGNFTEEIRLGNGINEINIKAKNKTNKETDKSYIISAKLPEIVVTNPQGTVLGTQTKVIDLQIEVNPNPVWLSVDVDGNRVFEGVMLKGTSQEFKAETSIVLNCGNAGSTRIILNGKDWGILGKEGEVKKGIKYTTDMIK